MVESQDKTNTNGTCCGEKRRERNGNVKVLKDPRDRRRKDKLITSGGIQIHIQYRCDEVRGKVNGEILQKRQKKTRTRLSNEVIMRQWSESECHHHVKEPQAFGKTRVWSVQLTTPYGRSLTKVRDEFVSGHGSKMITARVVGMHYPRNMQYLGYKIQSNYNTCTSKSHSELRHRGIDAVYVGVKLLNKHDRAPHEFLTERFPSPSPIDIE